MWGAKSPRSSPEPVRREGLTVLHDPVDCDLDIVITHGLNGAPYRTFCDERTGFFWPPELGKTLPKARVMVFGYVADISAGSTNSLGVYQHAEGLLLHLKNNRIGPQQEKRPLIFLGHSLGGVVIKQALVISSNRCTDGDILRWTKLIFFLGTPHRGSHILDKPLAKVGLSVMKLANREVPRGVKNILQPRTNESFMVNSDFMRILVKRQIEIVNFYEQVPRYPLQDLVVDKDSAVFDSEHSENIPMARDHEHLVRFESVDDDAFNTLRQTLQRKVAQVLETESKATQEGRSDRMMRACLRSLGDVTRLPTSLGQQREAHHKTLNWLWDRNSELLQWLRSGSGLFAVTGKPGSGKSVLMNELATRIRKDYMYRQNPPGVVVHHAFNARGAPKDHSLDGFLRFSIGQILRQRPLSFDAMLDEWLLVASDSGFSMADVDRHDWDGVGSIVWPITSLKRALRSIVSYAAHESPVCFLIDALDEYDGGAEKTGDLVNYLSLVSPATQSASREVRVCFSCRDLPSTMDAVLSGGFRMEHRNEPDIAAYINDKWATLAPIAEAGGELKKLKTELIRKADGIFLWAHLALERIQTALRDGATVAELRETVNDIPDELGGLFALLLGNINPKYAAETKTMLAIALSAQRPLGLPEFRHAVALATAGAPVSSLKELEESSNTVQDDATMRRRIRSRCGGLLEVKDLGEATSTGLDVADKASDLEVVQFIHQSVRDSLQSAREEYGSLVAEGHSTLARACIQYLSFKETHELAGHLRSGSRVNAALSQARLPLLSYAVEACFYHCQEAEKRGVPQAELIDQRFGQPEKDESFRSFVTIHNALRHGETYSLGLGLLQLAVEYNLAAYVEKRLAKSVADIDVVLEDGQTYVQIAVSRSHLETLKVLISHNADVNFSQVPYCGEAPYRASYRDVRPLVVACQKGSVELVQVLLENGAEVSYCTVSHGGMHINQALVSAAYSGNIEVVERLLNADPATFSHPEIRLSAITGLRDAVRELVEEESSAHRQGPSNKRVEADLEKMQKVSDLILCGTDVLQVDFESSISASLFWVLTGCHTEVLQRLADIGTDFSGVGRDGITFLHAACIHGTVESVRLLRQNGGFNPDIPCGPSELSCLHLAIANKKPAVLEYLLQCGLPINVLDGLGLTPLHDAAHLATDEFVDLLLRHGADRSILDAEGHRPFHYAVSNRLLKNHVQVLERLLCEDADIHRPNVRGRTAMHLAAREGALVAVEWLIEKSADPSEIEDAGRTALHIAASCRSPDSTDVLKCLLDYCTRKNVPRLINTRDSADMTPLHHVFWTYRQLKYSAAFDPAVTVANAKLLLRRGADLHARDNGGNTPLHMAAWRGVKELVKVFLLEGADPHAEDVNGLRPLDLTEMEDVREILEDAMADREVYY
ncbi:ankyrin repeat-containing domain protein [Lasiosphaeris hirsuta]|uniref:Ankyrin repeat-containing domain protein n=1 Tax=Lasiosphaeris hirsuta TaxID=260670 RepID=A0AA40B1F1_9PEZI|nr:ankyrin repeat-containing domain protein [Lasiosphaeris hirsuta]